MFNIFIILGILLLIQLYIVLYVSDKVKIREDNENYYNLNLFKKFIEILVIVIVIFYTCNIYLKNKLSNSVVAQITILIEVIVILFWLYLNFVESNIIDYDDNDNSNDDDNANNDNSNDDENDDDENDDDEVEIDKNSKNNNSNNVQFNDNKRIFSKYLTKNNTDFTFEDLYPNYFKKKTKSKSKKWRDLSKYDGYNSNHPCYKCSCLKKDDGYEYCGKLEPGLGTVGCSENWKCNNCRSCQSWDNVEGEEEDNSNNKLESECQKCKCYDSYGKIMCAKKAAISGTLIPCSKSCEKCLLCNVDASNSNNSNNSNNVSYETVLPKKKIHRRNIVINNISKKDIDNL